MWKWGKRGVGFEMSESVVNDHTHAQRERATHNASAHTHSHTNTITITHLALWPSFDRGRLHDER